jgi:hypothetical protein
MPLGRSITLFQWGASATRGRQKEDLLKALKTKGVIARDVVVDEPTLEAVFISLAC